MIPVAYHSEYIIMMVIQAELLIYWVLQAWHILGYHHTTLID